MYISKILFKFIWIAGLFVLSSVAVSQALDLSENQRSAARAMEGGCLSSANNLADGGSLTADQLDFFTTCTSLLSSAFMDP